MSASSVDLVFYLSQARLSYTNKSSWGKVRRFSSVPHLRLPIHADSTFSLGTDKLYVNIPSLSMNLALILPLRSPTVNGHQKMPTQPAPVLVCPSRPHPMLLSSAYPSIFAPSPFNLSTILSAVHRAPYSTSPISYHG